MAPHTGGDQGLPPLQPTAIQPRLLLGQLGRGAAGVALLRSQRGVGGGGLLPLPVPERCHKISICHQPGRYLVGEIIFCPCDHISCLCFLSVYMLKGQFRLHVELYELGGAERSTSMEAKH